MILKRVLTLATGQRFTLYLGGPDTQAMIGVVHVCTYIFDHRRKKLREVWPKDHRQLRTGIRKCCIISETSCSLSKTSLAV